MNNPPPRTVPIGKWWLKCDPGFNHQIPDSRFRDGTHSKQEERVVEFKIVEEINKGFSCWQFDNKELGFSSVEILQNCDLPPPAKVFTGEKEWNPTSFISPSPFDYLHSKKSMRPAAAAAAEEELCQEEYGDDKMGLLKALQLSQTRAREAEKKASLLSAEKEKLSDLFFNQSSQLFAYKQWVKLLEIHISKLQSQSHVIQYHSGFPLSRQNMIDDKKKKKKKKEIEIESGVSKWYFALSMCLGIAGVGFVLGWRSLSIQ